MLLVDIQSAIMAELEALDDKYGKRLFLMVDVWNDTPEEMIKKTIRLPAALVALSGGQFIGESAIGSGRWDCRLGWDVFVLFENLRTPADAAAQGLGFINAVVSAVSNLRVGNDRIAPTGFDLVATIGGKSAYAINFSLEERM
ncbi:MAG: hypothetical protein PHN84_14370 [Desulfuromonadaceae bacterium]|nr:hypothetical protein [Desulfuromonadaceae bacterium]MDD2855327.1 hypothetical protein [Desulfuromonadaceae bacterium]